MVESGSISALVQRWWRLHGILKLTVKYKLYLVIFHKRSPTVGAVSVRKIYGRIIYVHIIYVRVNGIS